MRHIRKHLQRGGVALGLVWVGTACLLDLLGPRAAPPTAVDAVVVAGCRVDPDGVPSDSLAARTDRAVELYRSGVAPLLVFTGGVGAHPPSEAEAAAIRAEAAGVPRAHMRLEDRSTSTWENARFAAETGELAHIVVVTDAWHTHRVSRVFAHHFDRVETVGVDSPLPYRVPGAIREVLAISYYAVRGRL